MVRERYLVSRSPSAGFAGWGESMVSWLLLSGLLPRRLPGSSRSPLFAASTRAAAAASRLAPVVDQELDRAGRDAGDECCGQADQTSRRGNGRGGAGVARSRSGRLRVEVPAWSAITAWRAAPYRIACGELGVGRSASCETTVLLGLTCAQRDLSLTE